MKSEFQVLAQWNHFKYECKTDDATRLAWIAALEWVIDDPALLTVFDTHPTGGDAE